MSSIAPPNTEPAILRRLLSQDAAEAILRLDFDDSDRERMHELAQKNQNGPIAAAEQEELETYRSLGRWLDLMRSKARISLKHSTE